MSKLKKLNSALRFCKQNVSSKAKTARKLSLGVFTFNRTDFGDNNKIVHLTKPKYIPSNL